MNVLFVSIAFPPKSDPAAIQVARYIKYLVREPGFTIDVVTSRNPTLWMPVDSTLEGYAQGMRQLIEVPIFEPRLISITLAKLFPGFVMLPDMRQSFHWQWRRVIQSLSHQPDVIFSRSFPLSSAIMGLKLQKHYKVPWIMHLSDPWTESPIIHFRGFSKIYNRRLQRICFERAAAVTFSSPRLVDFYSAQFPHWAHKFHSVPNVFDPDDIITPPTRPHHNGIRLVYTGSLQGERSIRHLIAALEWCQTHKPRALEGLSVELAGSLDSDERNRLNTSRFPFIKHLGHLSFAEVRKLQREADVLLAIDNPLSADDSVFLPSKLLDYVAACKPIVAITSHGSMSREFITPALGRCFDHSDAPGLGAFLLELLARQGDGDKFIEFHPSANSRYDARVNASGLANLMRGLRARPEIGR